MTTSRHVTGKETPLDKMGMTFAHLKFPLLVLGSPAVDLDAPRDSHLARSWLSKCYVTKYPYNTNQTASEPIAQVDGTSNQQWANGDYNILVFNSLWYYFLIQVLYVSGGGLCSIRSRSCKHVRLFGAGFRNTTSISCLFRLVRITVLIVKLYLQLLDAKSDAGHITQWPN